MGQTAAEIMAELAKNKKYQAEKKARDKRRQAYLRRIRADAKPLIKALRKVGVNVSSVWDLVNSSQPYEKAIPVLIEHLEKEYHPKTLAGIARALAVPDTNKFEGAWDVILALYEKTTPDEAINEPEFRGFKDGLAVALSAICNSERLKTILALVNEKRHGGSRVMLVDGLKKYRKNNEVKMVLKSLLDDNELGQIAKKVYRE